MATKRIGDTSAHETWESGARSHPGGAWPRRTAETVMTGEWASLLAQFPKGGGGKPAKFRGRVVVSAQLRPLRGGMGRLSVTTVLGKAEDAPEEEALREVVEIEMAQTERDVRTLLGGDGEAAKALAAWDDAPAALRAELKYEDADGAEKALEGRALSVARLILAGIESVLRFHPVVTRTTWFDEEPETEVEGLGEVGSEPQGAPAGYEYLKTGDHWTQQRDSTWTRVEQWTGAKTWNGSLYRNGTGEPKDISLLED